VHKFIANQVQEAYVLLGAWLDDHFS